MSRRLGPYTLLERLGTGGMAEVWKAERTATGGASKLLALKLLDPTRAAGSRRMFEGEARLSMLLNSANIVQVFDVGEQDGLCYMAMEWVDGMDLNALAVRLAASGERMPMTVVAHIVGELLKALAYAHEFEHEGERKVLIHRDISPHNVMLSMSGDVKLMDFGIARVASEETSGVHVKGKLRYMPPEQLLSQTKAPTLDLFAAGAVLHELLDGQKFRSGASNEERLLGMVFTGEVPPLSCPRGRVPREIERLRAKLLQVDPKRRVQSAREAHAMLARWSGYRDAKFELQDLLRRVRSSEDPLARGSGSMSQLAERGSETAERAELTSRRGRKLGVMWAIVATLVLVGGGVSAVVVMQGVSRGLDPEASLAAPTSHMSSSVPRSTDESERPPPSDIPVPAIPVPAPAPEEEPEREEVLESEEAIESEEVSEVEEVSTTKSRAKSRRIGVSVSAPGSFYAGIKIGKQVREIDRLTQVEVVRFWLAPGEYEVRYRGEAEGGWRDAGVLRVNARDTKVRVVIDRSGRLERQ